MDGRRHSVDIPISKALVALRRVRSLRDPSTLSMSKFSALIDNVNWETNSSHGISLRFLEPFEEGAPGKIGGLRLRNGENERVDGFELDSDFGDPKVKYYGKSSRNLHAGGLGYRRSYEDDIYKNKSLSERYCGNQIEKTGVIPSINPLEGVDSLNEPCVESLQGRIDYIDSQRNLERKNRATSFPESSPSLSNEEVDLTDDDDGRCGISCCFSGTPRFEEGDLSTDFEKNPLLRKNGFFSNNPDEIIPHSEIPRSLSQKFRPKAFSELTGQNVVARSLLGAIQKGRVTSLYLFHGPRGTGKTSASRIFAAALNCLDLDDDKPCGRCRECIVFFSGRSRDVKEVDSVAINKRESVKSLLKKASVRPVTSRFKIFIVDECHLLQSDTWATLLHSLDSFSRQTIFVIITPDLSKLPRSAVSRSQRYHFPKIKDSDIVIRLADICTEERLDFDEVALDFVASKSSGSMRDAVMMLDQLSLLGRKITVTLAHELVGVVSDDELLEFLDLAMSSDTSQTVIRARELMRSRIDPMQLISQLANLIMDILAGRKDGCTEVRRSFSTEVDLQKLSHALKILSETEKQLRMSKNQTTWLTVALLQLNSLECSPTDVNGSKFWLDDANDSGESLSCSCESKKLEKFGIPEDCKRTLEAIWKRAVGSCQCKSLQNFLTEHGKLSSLLVSQGVAVAELEFCHGDCVSKAEESKQMIANSLRTLLGCKVDVRINLVTRASKSTYAEVKAASLRLFSCSRRSCERYIESECSAYSSERPEMSQRIDAVKTGVANELSTRTALPKISSEDKYIDQSNYGNHVLSHEEPGNQRNCFPCFRLCKKYRSSVPAQIVHRIGSEEQQNLALSIMRRPSLETRSNNGHGDENRSRENPKSRCWRTPTLRFSKAWRPRHRRENSRSGGSVMPCYGAK